MPIPPFTIDGVLPPYVGPDGPGGAFDEMSPYVVTSVEVVATLGTTDDRKTILRGWLDHRAALRAIGFDRGFQWLDGSFVEDKDPKDVDVVTFLYRPSGVQSSTDLLNLMKSNPSLFVHHQVKTTFRVDFFPIDMNASPEVLVSLTRYFCGLFSHRRVDELWKGMLQVRLEDDTSDAVAFALLIPDPTTSIAGATP